MNDYFELLEIFSNQSFEDFVTRRNLFYNTAANSSPTSGDISPLPQLSLNSASVCLEYDSDSSSPSSRSSSFSASPADFSYYGYHNGSSSPQPVYGEYYVRDLRVVETPSASLNQNKERSASVSPSPDAIPAMLSRLSSAVSSSQVEATSPSMVIASPPPKPLETKQQQQLKQRPVGIKRSPQNRLVWTKNLHNLFVKALQTLGNNAMPKAILAYMGVEGLTRENISSHLQKHRLRVQRNELKKARKAAQAAEAKTRQDSFTSSFNAMTSLSPTPSPTSSEEEYPSSDDETFVEYANFSATPPTHQTAWCDNSISMYNTTFVTV